jgi:hypothetical protein
VCSRNSVKESEQSAVLCFVKEQAEQLFKFRVGAGSGFKPENGSNYGMVTVVLNDG